MFPISSSITSKSLFLGFGINVICDRNYPEAKLQENLDSEIMQVLLQEARDSYDEEIVIELRSDTTEEMEGNVERIEKWVEQWKKDNTDKS
jgi:adenylate kinase